MTDRTQQSAASIRAVGGRVGVDKPIPCERCGNPDVVGIWNPDGLCGHEILVCDGCWRDLNAQADDA